MPIRIRNRNPRSAKKKAYPAPQPWFDLVMSSTVELFTYEVKELVKYLALTVNKEEIQEHSIGMFLPRRYNEDSRNNKPIIAFLDGDTVKTSTGVRDKWVWDQWVEPTGDTLRLMCALLMRELVMVVLQGHVYTAGGRLYRQVLGGPIGWSLTKLIADILMRRFDIRFEDKVVKIGLNKPPMKERYVDDVDTVREAIKTEQEVVDILGRAGLLGEPAPEISNDNEIQDKISKLRNNT